MAAEAAGRINGWVSEQTQGKIPTLVSSEGLSISDVMHDAWVKVDEEGIEAAAATAMDWFGDDWSDTALTSLHALALGVERPISFLRRERFAA